MTAIVAGSSGIRRLPPPDVVLLASVILAEYPPQNGEALTSSELVIS